MMTKRQVIAALLRGELSREDLRRPTSRLAQLLPNGKFRCFTLMGERIMTKEEIEPFEWPMMFVCHEEPPPGSLPHRDGETVIINLAQELISDPYG